MQNTIPVKSICKGIGSCRSIKVIMGVYICVDRTCHLWSTAWFEKDIQEQRRKSSNTIKSKVNEKRQLPTTYIYNQLQNTPTLVFQETKVHKTTSKRTGSRVKMPTHSEQFRIWVNEIKYKITNIIHGTNSKLYGTDVCLPLLVTVLILFKIHLYSQTSW